MLRLLPGWRRHVSSTSSSDARSRILNAALAHVNRRGWSKDALAAGATDAGLPPASHGLFPRGAAELAEFWMEKGNQALRERAEQETEVKGAELVSDLLCRRLEHTVPFLRSWPQAMALGLYPANLPTTLQKLDNIPDIICKAASKSEGGRPDWLERKGAVGAIYASAELYMLTDYSEGYQDTRNFVRARVRDSLVLQSKIPFDAVNVAFQGVGSLITAAASMIAPMVPNVPPTMPGAPPLSPQDWIRTASAHAEHAKSTLTQIATSKDPARAAAEHLKQTVSEAVGAPKSAPAAPQAADSGVKAAKADQSAAMRRAQAGEIRPPQVSGTMDPFQVHEVDVATLDPVKLPSGMSLFGLLSMNANEAQEILKSSNPSFTIVVTKASDTDAEPVDHRSLVRLLVDDENIVVDVLRS